MSTNSDFPNLTFEHVLNRLVTNGYSDEEAHKAVQWILKEGYHFSATELMRLASTKQPSGLTTAHNLVRFGYFYSFDELMLLGNPACCEGWTISHEMAKNGYMFSVGELIVLKNLACCSSWTVAHEMAKNGHMFSVDDLLKLENPTDDRGLTIADVMALNGYTFADSDKKEMGIDLSAFAYTAYPSYDIRHSFNYPPTQPTTCPECGHSLTQSSVSKSKYAVESLKVIIIPAYDYSYLFVCRQCHWWCIRESWCEYEYDRDYDYLVVGVAKNKTSTEINGTRPWEKALSDENIYIVTI